MSILHDLMLRGHPTTSDLWMAFDTIAALVSKPVYCIVDGVDESVDKVIELLQRLLSFLESRVNFRFILLCRQHAFHGIKLIRHELKMQSALTKGDVDRVIEDGIDQSDILRLPSLRDKVFRTLRGKSDGNFLWTELMLGHLNTSLGLVDALERLKNLPRDLEAAYEDLRLGLVDKLEPDELELSRKVFAFIIISQRPLSLDEFQHLLAADAMSICTHDGHSIEDYLIPQLSRRIIDLCGDLINVINGCLQLVHFSVKEFLVRPGSQWSRRRRRRKIMIFRVSLDDAHRWFAAACIEYLEKCDYGSPLHDWDNSTELGRNYHFLRYSSTHMITHIHQSGLPSGYILKKIDRFLNSDRWIAWLELYSMNIIEDGSLHSQDDELEKFAFWLGERPEKVLLRASSRLKVALEKRAKEYGQHDSRTEQLRLFLGFLEHACAPTSAEAMDSCAFRSTDQTTNVLPIIQILRHNAPLTLQLQVDLLLKMQMYLQKAKRLTDPLQILFRVILQKASAMPVYVLLLVGAFYLKVGKFEQALEIYFVALRKVKEKDVPVKFLVLHLIGITYHNLGQNERALEQFRYALEGRERVLGPEHGDTLLIVYWIGIIYEARNQYEDALGYFIKTLAGRKKVLGPEHKDTLYTLYSIGHA
ncbi:hypothetical protein BDV34DRAFT_221597 [Aspergillus parasiticus]|uniref:Tetratricopeptide repeat n=1 Tax=Aspergillus parasiticus TaxID=5067 RepID=A0A5N6DWP1_ASPPA|nr:hypothetical protein BDV34DRAFT_221597 [Aspergillus parasiticus]